MKKNEMDIIFLLDRSGSMCGCESDTIGGYNSYINEQKNNNVNVTTILFDDKYEVINDRVPIKDVKKLTSREYFVRGSTSLLDAIGNAINYIDSKNSKKALFVITTDGYENSSKEFSKSKIRKMIREHTKYEFMYIGADIDSYSEGTSLGISKKNISSYKKDRDGISKLFKAASCASDMFYDHSEIDYSWKEELENYINENKNS